MRITPTCVNVSPFDTRPVDTRANEPLARAGPACPAVSRWPPGRIAARPANREHRIERDAASGRGRCDRGPARGGHLGAAAIAGGARRRRTGVAGAGELVAGTDPT